MSSYLPVFASPQGEAEVLRAYDVVLRHWPVPYTELDIATTFGQTHVIVSGAEKAPPVILLHALFATATSWYRTVGPLSRYHRTLAVDVIGESNKSRPTRPVLSLEDYKQWFTELADGLGVSTMSLVGNSMGGFCAAYLAMHMPERIRKLVLIDPAATFHSIIPFYVHMFVPKALYLFLPWLPGRNTVMRRSVDWAFAGLPSDGPWEELFKLSMVHGSTQSRVFPRVYTAQELARIEVPTLLILGDREKIYRASEAKRAALRLMPDVQVQIIPRAHHIAAIAQPDAVNESLLDFLDG